MHSRRCKQRQRRRKTWEETKMIGNTVFIMHTTRPRVIHLRLRSLKLFECKVAPEVYHILLKDERILSAQRSERNRPIFRAPQGAPSDLLTQTWTFNCALYGLATRLTVCYIFITFKRGKLNDGPRTTNVLLPILRLDVNTAE